MTKSIRQIKQMVKICLSDIKMYSSSAEALILGTGAVESKYKYFKQLGGSEIARSYWQIEPTTCVDNIVNYLGFRQSKLKLVADSNMINPEALAQLNLEQASDLLTFNVKFAIQMARIKYYRVPKRLPDADDIEGLGKYWLKYYNAGGKGSMEKWMEAQEILS